MSDAVPENKEEVKETPTEPTAEAKAEETTQAKPAGEKKKNKDG
jgi:hypothetical protein